jgi:eukaryotic-like serine/threonine-protein kinase
MVTADAAGRSDEAPCAGTLIAGRYRVGQVVGGGGMGRLVEAEHVLLGRTVLIKFVRANRGATGRERLLREARAIQSLTSENVVRVHDLGVYDGAPYVVMERLRGRDLGALVAAEGPLSIGDAVDCVTEAAVALTEAHGLGIVHRDVKPANLFLCQTRTHRMVKVLDFGIAKTLRAEGEEAALGMTGQDAVLGTPLYMSPEQIRNPARVDERTDVWGLGVTLFFLLTGTHPFRGGTTLEVAASIFSDAPRSLCALRPDAAPELAEVVERSLARLPDERTPTVAELALALTPWATRRGLDAADRVRAASEGRVLAVADRRPPAQEPSDEGLASTISTTGTPRVAPAGGRWRSAGLGAVVGGAAIGLAVFLDGDGTGQRASSIGRLGPAARDAVALASVAAAKAGRGAAASPGAADSRAVSASPASSAVQSRLAAPPIPRAYPPGPAGAPSPPASQRARVGGAPSQASRGGVRPAGSSASAGGAASPVLVDAPLDADGVPIID